MRLVFEEKDGVPLFYRSRINPIKKKRKDIGYKDCQSKVELKKAK